MAELEMNTSGETENDLHEENPEGANTRGTGEGEGGSDAESLYAGKYKSVEELEKGYAELSKKLSGGGTEDDPEADSGDSSGGDPGDSSDADEPNTEENSGGIDWDGLNSEYADKGELSEDSYKNLEKAGIPKREVDRYIAGRQAEADAFDNAVYESAGDKDSFESMVKWAADNYTDAQKKTFNKAMDEDQESAITAVTTLRTRFEKENGKTPNLLNGKGGGNAGPEPFKSQAQVTQAMRDSRYRNDPAYREEVANRLAASQLFG